MTVTTCVQVAELPLASVAVQVTIVIPIGNSEGALLVSTGPAPGNSPSTQFELCPVSANS